MYNNIIMEKLKIHITKLKKELFLMENIVNEKKNIKINKKIIPPAGHITPILNKTNLNFQKSLRN